MRKMLCTSILCCKKTLNDLYAFVANVARKVKITSFNSVLPNLAMMETIKAP